MDIEHFKIPGLLLFHPKKYTDNRGYFIETFQNQRYGHHISEPFVQDNLSLSKKGVIRGLHFQSPPFAQGKLVQVLKGSVLDVAVDLRKNSPTYGQHIAVELNERNAAQFFIPEGFAHGFQALEEDTVFTYKCSNYYNSEHEETLRWDDEDLGIIWPLEATLVSDKDQLGMNFKSFNSPF